MSDPLLNIIRDLRFYKPHCMVKSTDMIYFCGVLNNAVEYNLAFIKITTCDDIPVYLNLNKEELKEMIRSLQLALRKMEMMGREHPSACDNFEDVLEKIKKEIEGR